MRQYTNLPHTNNMMASHYILEHGPDINRHYRGNIPLIVDDFMRSHPRGKGTSGNMELREFYTACHTYKAYHSRSSSEKASHSRRSGRIAQLSDPIQRVFATFLPDLPIKPDKKHNRQYAVLIKEGLISGYCVDSGDYVSLWLTDIGLTAHQILISVNARKDHQRRIEQDVRIRKAVEQIAAINRNEEDATAWLYYAIDLAKGALN